MNETSKAMRRRRKEVYVVRPPRYNAEEGEYDRFYWENPGNGMTPAGIIFQGHGIDIGCGPDKLPFENCIPFDKGQGDANDLRQHFVPELFDYVHASHVLEHMHDPEKALRSWIATVKPGGFVICTVPDVGAYERFQWPSRHNPDHKSTWSMVYRGSRAPIHCHIPTFLKGLEDVAEVVVVRYVEENYDWKKPESVDQTWIESDGVEIWNEFVLQKHQ